MGLLRIYRRQPVTLGQIIKNKRHSANLTQVELAEKADLSQAQISLIEKGVSDNITIGNLRKIAKALGCTVIDLLPDSDKPENTN